MSDRPTRIKLISNLCRALEALLIDALVEPSEEHEEPRCDDPACDAQCTTPGAQVSAEIAARGLRVGMTWREVRDNRWTKCENQPPCAPWDSPLCDACQFMTELRCACAHSFDDHSSLEHSIGHCWTCDECPSFSLASWPGMPPIPQQSETLAHACRLSAPTAGVVATHSGASGTFPKCDLADPPITDEQQARDVAHVVNLMNAPPEPPPTPRPQRRADPRSPDAPLRSGRPPVTPWAQTEAGVESVAKLRDAIAQGPAPPWTSGALRKLAGLTVGDTVRALGELMRLREVSNKSRAFFGPYGFTDWPKPKAKPSAPVQEEPCEY